MNRYRAICYGAVSYLLLPADAIHLVGSVIDPSTGEPAGTPPRCPPLTRARQPTDKENIMTSTRQKRPPRRRFAAAAILAAGAIAAGTLGPAAPANAAGTFVALAYQQSYGFGGKLIYRDAHGIGRSSVFDTARVNALNDCQKNGGQTGGGQCEVRVVANNQCAAVAASNGAQGWKIATATSYNQQLAEQIAVANNRGGLVVVSACPT
jgi:hypothetical protein